MNLEMAVTDEMIPPSHRGSCPRIAGLVPESRQEITTEGGLNVVEHSARIGDAVKALGASGCESPCHRSGSGANRSGAARRRSGDRTPYGRLCRITGAARAREFRTLCAAANFAARLGLIVNACHGSNTTTSSRSPPFREIVELNIGTRSVSRAIVDGLAKAVRDMKELMRAAAMIYGRDDLRDRNRCAQGGSQSRAFYKKYGERFLSHLLMPEERAQFERTARPVRFIAMRFAAKEAIVKGMGTGFAHGSLDTDVGVVQNSWGRPEVVYSARGAKVRDGLGIGEGHVTLTDEAGLVVAVAVLMRRAPHEHLGVRHRETRARMNTFWCSTS